MFRRCLVLLAALSLPACIIVTDDPDDDDSGAGETESAEGGSEPLECEAPGSFSFFDNAGMCVCEDDLVWCTDDPEDFACCLPVCGDPGTNSQVASDGQCDCIDGFDWCTEDPDDITCCES